MNEAWLVVSTVAGLVAALVGVWRIVARASRGLRDEFGGLRDEFREEIRVLRENDLKHLERGIEGLDARMSRVEERMIGRVAESEERTVASLARMHERLSRSEERMMERLNRAEERNAISFREIRTDLRDTRAELLEAIRAESYSSEAGASATPP